MFFKRLFKKDKYNCFYGERQYGKTNYELRKEIERLKEESENVKSTLSIIARRNQNARLYINHIFDESDENKIIDNLLHLDKILSGDHYKTFNDMIERNSKNEK